MKFQTFVDNAIGFRGRVVVALMDNMGKELDRELVLKFPAGLRIRCMLARWRLAARLRKITKINAA